MQAPSLTQPPLHSSTFVRRLTWLVAELEVGWRACDHRRLPQVLLLPVIPCARPGHQLQRDLLRYACRRLLHAASSLQKKKNHYIFSSQLRANQMPGPPQAGQLMFTLLLSTSHQG